LASGHAYRLSKPLKFSRTDSTFFCFLAGKLCIEVDATSKIAFISEDLCIGCGICPKKCPFGAIHIINLPTNLEKEVTHRYSANSFKLHRLPVPRPGQVLGLVGTNGIGKSTALKVLAGKMKPNLGNFDNPPDWQDILKYFRGSELQNYFTKILEDNLKVGSLLFIYRAQHGTAQHSAAGRGGLLRVSISRVFKADIPSFFSFLGYHQATVCRSHS
jgi:translation initiation factor RLI1